MFKTFTLTSLALATLGFALTAAAEPFEPVMNVPLNYKDFQYGVNEVKTNINSVQCGGWVDSAGRGSQLRMPKFKAYKRDGTEDPIALPGRDNVSPFGNAVTGVGVRGGFQYPDSAFGYESACNIYDLTMTDDDLARLGKDIKMHDGGSCSSGAAPGTCVNFDGGYVEVVDGGGVIDINPFGWCIRHDKATPKYCKKLFDAWRRMSVLAGIHPPVTSTCDCESHQPNDGCPPRPAKRYCFDPGVLFECEGTSGDRPEPIDAIQPPILVPEFAPEPPIFTDAIANMTCRTDWEPYFLNKMTECSFEPVICGEDCFYWQMNLAVAGEHYALASSYYRHYATNYMEPGVQVDPIGTLRAECYEYYEETVDPGDEEFDPKEYVTSGEGQGDDNDEQCEIIPTTETPEWPDISENTQKENVPGPTITDPSRPSRSVPDPWVADQQTNLAILDIEALREIQRGFDDPDDITGAIGVIIETKQRASKTVPDNARTDMFDDSDHRAMSKYWEAQENILLELVRDPTVRLIMPARFLVGLDDNNPLFQYVRGMVSRPNGTVELTLRAGPEDIGNVLASFKKSYVLPLTEVRIPILIPLASKAEIDALIFEWEEWKQDETLDAERSGRTSFADQADPLIEKLREYRDALDQERILRNALSRELIDLLEPLRTIDQFMANWYRDNTQKLLEAAQSSKQIRQLKNIWRHIQHSMLQADRCQLQWCSNQRYSLDVYSLLDEWWGDKPPHEKRNKDYVPPDDLRNFSFTRPKDQLYDFSFLSLPKGDLKIPVLWPVQVKIKLPHPPLLGSQPESPENFPVLPDLPDASVFDAFTSPTVSLPSPRILEIPAPVNLDPAKDVLRKFRKMIDGTTVEAQVEQEAREDANRGIAEDEGEDFTIDRKSMRGAYCRFIRSVLIEPNEDSGNPDMIVHIENDLKERVARLYSRWLPNRIPDFAGRTQRVRNEFPTTPPKCKEDVVCAFLPAETTTKAKWQMFFPNTESDFNSIAGELEDLTLPETEEENPYLHAPIPVLERFFPHLDLPIEIDLRPTSTP